MLPTSSQILPGFSLQNWGLQGVPVGVQAVWYPAWFRALKPPRAALELAVRSQLSIAAGDSKPMQGVQTQARPGLSPGDFTAS